MTRPDSQDAHADSPSTALHRLIIGFRASRALYVAATLGIADLLVDGPKSGEELAASTGTHAPSLDRVLRALVSAGVFAQDAAGRFILTPVGSGLRTGVPGSFRAYVILSLRDEEYRAWGELLHTVRTGETAFDHLFGVDVWTYRAGHPDQGKIFDEGMSNLTGATNEAVTAAYSFAPFARVVDVGGGDGTLMITLLRANPRLHGVIFDVPRITETARTRIAGAGLEERCEVVAGDAFVAVPGGGDAYLLSRVIHDWDDLRAAAILKNCRRAMPPHGRVLLVERVLPTPIERSPAAETLFMSDLNMLVMTGGRERTEAEFQAILEAAGLRMARIVPTQSVTSVIEAIPA